MKTIHKMTWCGLNQLKKSVLQQNYTICATKSQCFGVIDQGYSISILISNCLSLTVYGCDKNIDVWNINVSERK